MNISVSVAGVAAVERNLAKLGASAPTALGAEFFAEANNTITEAKRLAPVDLGNLRGSGHVQLPTITGSRVTVEAGFGGPAMIGNVGSANTQPVNYALVQHERLDYHHTVGQAKYLETPLKQRSVGLPARIARALQRWLNRGGTARGAAG